MYFSMEDGCSQQQLRGEAGEGWDPEVERELEVVVVELVCPTVFGRVVIRRVRRMPLRGDGFSIVSRLVGERDHQPACGVEVGVEV